MHPDQQLLIPQLSMQALDVLEKYNLSESVPDGILKFLKEGATGLKPETPKPGDPVFEKTHNLLIGTNSLALEAAKQKALEL